MFQYAAGRRLLKNKNLLYLDTQFYADNSTSTDYFAARNYELKLFKKIKALHPGKWRLSLFLGSAFYLKLLRKAFPSFAQYFHHPGTKYIPLDARIKSRHVYIDGYFQSEKYFSSKREAILNEFTFPPLDEENRLIAQKMNSSVNSVSLHIRRGDYLKSNINSVHGTLPLSYYEKALGLLQGRHPDITLFVFSDDMPWVKKNLSTNCVDTLFIENNYGVDSWKDMALMANCKHHIIANSSFSWWGAWLATKGGEVYAPYNWFQPSVEFDINDIIPKSWTVVYYE
jgi:hypothetical protein